MNTNWTEIKEKLFASKNIIITSHQSPDGDAVGSSLAMYNFLRANGLEPSIILPDEFASYYKWINGAENVKFYSLVKEECDTHFQNADFIFCLDYNSPKRVGEMMGAMVTSSAYKLMIDHHPNPENFCNQTYSNTSNSSTCEMVYEFITAIGYESKIDVKTAEAVYCGMVTDTGSFRFSSVTSRTHEIVAQLIKKGLKPNRIHEAIFDQNSLDKIKLQGHVLNNQLEYLSDVKTTIIYLTNEDRETYNIQAGDTEGLVNIALSIKGTEVAAFFREDKGKIKISFRSKGSIEVNKLSEKYFSGGGHRNAAGGQSDESLQSTIALYKKVIHEFV